MENTITLQNATVNAPATFNFKSAALNAYSRQIAVIGRDMANKNVELAKVLGKVKREECYKEDGFKSVSEYAEETFGIKKSQAYQLANVGDRFYNNDSPTAQRVAALLTPANLAEVAGMEDKEIDAAIDSGAISKDSTQKQLRETAKAHKDSSKVTIEKAHDIAACIVSGAEMKVATAERMTLPAFETAFLCGKFGFTDIISKKFTGDSKDGVVLYLSSNGDFAKVNYTTPSPAKAEPKAKKQKFTVEQLQVMLEAAIAERGNQGEDMEDAEG